MQREDPKQNAIVLLIEGLGTGLVGAYGANTSRTASIDRLAARGVVLDQCFVDSISIDSQMQSLWTGLHALQSSASRCADSPWTIWSELSKNCVAGCLLTDCETVASQAEEMGCSDVILIRPPLNAVPTSDSAECSVMHLFAAAAEELATGREGLVWIHSRGLKLPWDAPVELRWSFTDPDDPQPPHDVAPPDLEVDTDTDPDLIVGWGQVAAAQTSVIDEGVALLEATLAARDDRKSWSWLLASLGGVPLGESKYLGWGKTQLTGAQLACVAILVPSEFGSLGHRRTQLFQLPDLTASILSMLPLETMPDGSWGQDCLGLEASDSPHRWATSHQLAVLQAASEQWIRCPAWSALFAADQPPQLFVKPDDRWEVSDIADRRVDVVEQLESLLGDFRKAIEIDRRGQWPQLPDELTNLLR